MTKDEAISWFGNKNRLANMLGIDASNINRWQNIPRWHQRSIERMTGGKLKADPDKGSTMLRATYFIPAKSHKEFKKYCRKKKQPMSKKIHELIERELQSAQ